MDLLDISNTLVTFQNLQLFPELKYLQKPNAHLHSPLTQEACTV